MSVRHIDYTELGKRLPEGCYFIDPRQPERTASQFLDWYAKQPKDAALPNRKAMRETIFEFLDTAAWWHRSVQGPRPGGPRDQLIIPVCPGARDINRIAQALRQAF
jgi:hypothetical protein